MKKQKEGPVYQSKTLKKQLLVKFIKKHGKCSVSQLIEGLRTTSSSVYRYFQELENDGVLEKDFDDCYYIVDGKNSSEPLLSDGEWKFVRKLVKAAPRSAVRDSIHKKLVSITDLEESQVIQAETHTARFIEKLEKSMRLRRQVMLMNYHSANSKKVSNRLVEPIHFGDNYQTIVVFDPGDMKCKHFKLDRIGDIIIKRPLFKHEKLHKKMPVDIFGYTGITLGFITLRMSLRAYVMLKETYLRSIPYLTKENDDFIFKGPVSSYEGIGHFVLGMLNDITVIDSGEFRDYLMKRIRENVL